MPFLIRVRNLGKKVERSSVNRRRSSSVMRVGEGNSKKWDFRLWKGRIRKLFSPRIWHIVMINESMMCRVLRKQDPCCSHLSRNFWNSYYIAWTNKTKFGRLRNPTYKERATALCELFRRQETDFYQDRIFKFVPRWNRHIRVLWEMLKDRYWSVKKATFNTLMNCH